MKWYNLFGLVFMIVMMVPNIVYAVRCKDGFNGKWKNKKVETLEQIGRFGCLALMIFNIPSTCFGFRSDEAFAVYLIVDSALLLCYCLVWIFCFRRGGMFRALALSVIPSVIFLFSGIMSRSVLLIAFALVFAPCHITISCKNTATQKNPSE